MPENTKADTVHGRRKAEHGSDHGAGIARESTGTTHDEPREVQSLESRTPQPAPAPPPPAPDYSPGKVTVNLTARSVQALLETMDLTKDTKTDTINRALQIYAYLEEVMSHGGSFYIRERPTSDVQQLKIFTG